MNLFVIARYKVFWFHSFQILDRPILMEPKLFLLNIPVLVDASLAPCFK